MNKEVEGRSLRGDLMIEKAVHCGVCNTFLWASVCLGEPSVEVVPAYSPLIGPRAGFARHVEHVGMGVDAAGRAYVLV